MTGRYDKLGLDQIDRRMDTTDYEEFVQGFAIFEKYQKRKSDRSVWAGHEEVKAGPDPSKVSDDDLKVLTAIGWHPSDEDGCFYKFT